MDFVEVGLELVVVVLDGFEGGVEVGDVLFGASDALFDFGETGAEFFDEFDLHVS